MLPKHIADFDFETLHRAHVALEAETDMANIRFWAALLAKGYIGDTPPPPTDSGHDQGRMEIILLMGAEARA